MYTGDEDAFVHGLIGKKRDRSTLRHTCEEGKCVEKSDEESPSKRYKQCLPYESRSSSSLSQRFLDLENEMCQELSSLCFSPPVTHIYNPLMYASEPHRCYVNSYANSTKRVMFFGMNPGPFGMAQTGVCCHSALLYITLFGEVAFVRFSYWLCFP